VESNLAVPRAISQTDDSHIDQLVVSGRGHEAVEALQSVKNRIDENTTVCLMNDGLGVLEDVRRKVFEGTDAAPNFLLGHMSHRLAFNRTYDAVTQLKQGQTRLTFAEAPRMRVKDMHKIESRPNFVRALEEAKDLDSSLTPFDQWLRFKLPSVIFDSVVEPVCVLLEMPYQGLLQNPAAQRMMQSLLSEIIQVLESMPELQGSTVMRDYIHSKGIRRFMHTRILGKRSQPSQLVRRIENGLPTDVEYLNGYFLRRGQRLGLDLRMNLMMRDMIKAKHSQAIERLNSFIPVEETSVPSDLAFRYRTTPR
jgi:ketopantoate reductase